MQYYVIGQDGNRYGPGDLKALQEWVQQDRIARDTLLEEMGTGQRILASGLAGLFDADQPQPAPRSDNPYSAPSAPGDGIYPRPDIEDGSKEATTSFVFSGLSWVFCPVLFGAIGYYYATKAATLGHRNAQGAKVFAIITMCITGFGLFFLMYVIGAAINGMAGGVPP